MAEMILKQRRSTLLAICSLLLLGVCLSSCNLSSSSPGGPAATGQQAGQQTNSFQDTSNSANQPITYSTNPHDVLIRTFYGGGLYGSLSPGPQLSIYGDGTYIIGLDQQGQLSIDALQHLLNTLVNTDGLLNFSRHTFADIQDQNATFLELALNEKQEELMYGPFGTLQESKQDMDEFHRLGAALTTINKSIKGPTQPYHSTNMALLVRQIFKPDPTQPIRYWLLNDFTLAQAAAYECGLIPPSDEPNPEIACLKFVIPDHAILLNATQLQALKGQMNAQQGLFLEGGLYYIVMLRPLLPDELTSKVLAMFGSSQGTYRGVPLLNGTVPPVPTPTPQK